MKRCSFVLLLLVMAPALQAEPAVLPQTSQYSQKQLLKNWALSRCLGEISDNEAVAADANRSAAGYFEFSSVPVEGFEKLSALVGKYAGARYRGSVEGSFHTMQCIDLFHSAELERLVTRVVPKRR